MHLLYPDHFGCLHMMICHLLVSDHTKHASHYSSGVVVTPHRYPENVYSHPTNALEDIHDEMKGSVGPIATGNECLVTTQDKSVGD